MKSSILCFFLFFLSNAFARGSEWLESNAEWFKTNHEYVYLTIRDGNQRELIPIISTLGMLWGNADGAIGSEVAPAIAAAMIHRPKSMLSWFEKNPNGFDRWLSQAQYDVFTDYSDSGVERLEQVRVALLASLKKYREEEQAPTLKQMAARAYETISALSIRTIE